MLLLHTHSHAPGSDQHLDITIELKSETPNAELQLKVSADIKEVKYEVRKGKGRTIRRISNDRMYVLSSTHHSGAKSMQQIMR